MNKLLSLLLSFSLLLSPLHVVAREPEKVDPYLKEGRAGENSGTGSATGRAFYFKQTAMMAGSVIGLNMVTCVGASYHWSHYVFAGGGAVFIAGELATIRDTNDHHKRKKSSLEIDENKLNKPAPGVEISENDLEMQTKALKEIREEEVHNKRSMEKRKRWADIVKIIYGLAAASAGAELALSMFPVYTGFVPDMLTCAGLPAAAGITLGVINVAYEIKNAVDMSGGKLGLSTAGFFALLQLETMTLATIASFATTVSYGRIAFYGGYALLARNISEGLEDRINIANQNIAKLDAAIAQWEAGSKPNGGVQQGPPTNLAGTEGTAINFGTGSDQNNLSNAAAPKPKPTCLGKSGAGIGQSSGNCGSPLRFNTKLPTFKIPALGKMTRDALKFSDDVSRGETGSAIDMQGDGLLASAAALKDVQKQVFDDLNKQRKEKGLPAFDYDAESQAKYKEIMNDMKAAGQKAGSAITDFPGDGTSDGKATLDDMSATKVASNAPVVPAPATAVGNLPSTSSALENALSSETAEEKKDVTGMSDEEKDILAANYDRNKGAYKTKEDDSLFQVLSKTYVRNLDKILTRKKKLDDDSASFPSAPSTP